MAGTSSPEFDMLRRQFTTTLQNAASAFRAAGMVVEQYGKIIEHGGIPTAHEITQIALQLPVIAAGGLAPPVQTEGDTKKRKRGPKKEKDPNAPKRPPSAYLLYQNDVRQQVKEAYPEKTYNELITEISKMWGELTPEEKKPYVDANEVAKGRYEREKAAYDATQPAAGPAGLISSIGLPAETPAAEADASSSEDAPSPVVIKAPTPPPKVSKAKAAKEAKEAKEKEAKEAKEAKAPKSSNAKPRKSRAAAEPAPPPALDSDEDGMADADAEAAEVEHDEEEDARPAKRAKKDRSSSNSPKKDKKEKANKSRK